MNEEQINVLLSTLIQNATQKKKDVLLIFTCGDCYKEEVKNLLLKFRDQCCYHIIFSDEFKRNMSTENWLELGHEINEFTDFRNKIDDINLVLIPFLTRNSLAKIALGITDTFSLVAIQHSLLSNTRVIAFDNSWKTKEEIGKIKKINENQAYTDMLLSYQTKITKLGVMSIPLSEGYGEIKKYLANERENLSKEDTLPRISEKDKSKTKKIYTFEDVKNDVNITIDSKVKLTDLAKEYLEKKEEEKNNA